MHKWNGAQAQDLKDTIKFKIQDKLPKKMLMWTVSHSKSYRKTWSLLTYNKKYETKIQKAKREGDLEKKSIYIKKYKAKKRIKIKIIRRL